MWIYEERVEPSEYEGFVYLIKNKKTEKKYVAENDVYITNKGSKREATFDVFSSRQAVGPFVCMLSIDGVKALSRSDRRWSFSTQRSAIREFLAVSQPV